MTVATTPRVQVRIICRFQDDLIQATVPRASREEALAYLRGGAEDARAARARRVYLDEREGILIYEFDGNDTTIILIEEGVA